MSDSLTVCAQDTGNKVSRRATISGPQNIILGGKTIIASGAIIRGDLRRTGPGHAVVISLGRYCLIGEGCVMRYACSVCLHNMQARHGRRPQTSIQDVPRKFQLLSHEDRRSRTCRRELHRGGCDNWEPCRDRQELHHRMSSVTVWRVSSGKGKLEMP